MRRTVFILALLLLIPAVFAQRGHVVLLAVMDDNGNITGTAADLYLEIKPGLGRVFIETYPLTKVDTQISTRFAKDVACKYSEEDCSEYDFFYTIRANSPLVGGPSAGAAAGILTVALLKDAGFDENTAITGTINSGGVIGPVGGLKEKLDAANERKIKKVLIPKGESIAKKGNITVNLTEYGKGLGIEVAEVSDLNEAVFYFTGKSYEARVYEPEVDEEYSRIMEYLADSLCNKSSQFNDAFLLSRINFSSRFLKAEEEALGLIEKGYEEKGKSHYYSAASYCFGADVRYRYMFLLSRNMEKENINLLINETRNEIAEFRKKIPKYETINDLQAYGAVVERIEDASLQLDNAEESLEKGNVDSALYTLAYAKERFDSAHAWASFFGKKGKKFDLGMEAMKDSCDRKLAEAEERAQYAKVFYQDFFNSSDNILDRAYEEQKKENYELCLFKAARAKAEASTVLDVISVDERIGDVIDRQLEIIKKNIVLQTNDGIFPIVSYSYYEYASSLKEEDPYSAILYSELAAELSGLDLYFKTAEPKEKVLFNIQEISEENRQLIIFIAGIALGAALMIALRGRRAKRKGIVVKKRK